MVGNKWILHIIRLTLVTGERSVVLCVKSSSFCTTSGAWSSLAKKRRASVLSEFSGWRRSSLASDARRQHCRWQSVVRRPSASSSPPSTSRWARKPADERVEKHSKTTTSVIYAQRSRTELSMTDKKMRRSTSCRLDLCTRRHRRRYQLKRYHDISSRLYAVQYWVDWINNILWYV